MFRALLDGLAFEGRGDRRCDGHRRRPAPFQSVLTIGSALENRLLAQLKADAYGLPVRVNSIRDAGSLGAALLAGMDCGLFADASAAMRVARREEINVEPNVEPSKRLQMRYQEVYRGLYGQLRTAHHRLHAVFPEEISLKK
jgi:sugar (pentulose or hexulose) kinase